MSRSRAVREWTRRAIEKFYLGFIIPDRVSTYYQDYEVFFYAHGLEVLCKAYIVGKEFPRYKDKSFKRAKEEIESIVRPFSHNLEKLADELTGYGIIPKDFLSKVHCRLFINNVDMTNRDILKTLRSLYSEARYPVPQLDYQRFYEERMKGNRKAKNRRTVGIPSASSEMSTFTRKLFAMVLKRIEKDFGMEISRVKLRSDIDDRDWERFSNLFFRQGES